jgi:hypothetical protein
MVKTRPMSPTATTANGPEEVRVRLDARREELQQTILIRVRSLADPGPTMDPAYLDGLRDAVTAAIDFGLEAVQRAEVPALGLPPPVLSQARLAARVGVSLDTILRRYFSGQAVLGDFIIEEAEHVGMSARDLRSVLRAVTTRFESLVAAVTEEHRRESSAVMRSVGERRADRVERLLAAELTDAADLGYDFHAHHLALVGGSADLEAPLRVLAARLDRRLLVVRRETHLTWAWLGGSRPINLDAVSKHLAEAFAGSGPLAWGEPGESLCGWRLSHQQALAAMRIARLDGSLVRYRDSVVIASLLADDLARSSLQELFLTPLERSRDRGELAKKTLRAYFAAERNASSAAMALGVSRQTVTKRLRVIEELLGRPVGLRNMELEAVLRLDSLGCLKQGGLMKLDDVGRQAPVR